MHQVYQPKVCAYGFIEKKNILENANNHKQKRIILNIDLKDFFFQIHFGRIRGLFMSKPYELGEEAATTIAQIACLNGHLPQGAPTSPVLSNMICASLDNQLMRLAKSTACTYTRYADDITFSTNKQCFSSDIVYIKNKKIFLGAKLLSILNTQSFSVNPEKISYRTNFERQEVTGLTVNCFPNLRRSYITELRSILHHCSVDGVYPTAQEYVKKGFCKNSNILTLISDPHAEGVIVDWFKAVLKGKIDYIKQIKGDTSPTFRMFAKKINTVFEELIFDISTVDKFTKKILENVYIIESSSADFRIQGSGFYLKDHGLLTNEHVTTTDCFYKIYRQNEYSDHAIAVIGKDLNHIKSNSKIDYALYKITFTLPCTPFLIGDSHSLVIGASVTTIGYPNHQLGNTAYIQQCSITSQKKLFGTLFYTISGRVVHGASGGIVLDATGSVIGLLRGGVCSTEATPSTDDLTENHGFTPIHLVLEDL